VKLLALDTATDLCSAALWIDGQLEGRETLAPRGQGRLLLPMVDALLSEAALSLRQLDAIAFGRGPGAFTGLRLAAAVAQGLGFAAGLPLIPVSDLRALAAQALEDPLMAAATRVLVCQDARMGQVYWGCFERRDGRLQPIDAERVDDPVAVRLPAGWGEAAPVLCAVGSGFAAYPALMERLGAELGALLGERYPRAREVAVLAVQDGMGAALAPEAALPVYLRDRVADVPDSGRN